MQGESNNLRVIRLQAELAMWGLSAQSKVSPALISAVEKWGYYPGEKIRVRLAEALDVRVDEIWPALGEQGEPSGIAQHSAAV